MGGVDGQVASRQQAARIAARDGRPAEALAHMEAACQLAPDRGDLHFQLACLHALGGAFEPALEHFRTTTRLLPDFADGWRLFGTTLVRTRRVGEARQALRRAHELAPGNVPALRALAEMEFLHGWPADALPLWQSLLDRDAGDIEARLRTGESLHRLGDQARAVAVFNEGVRLAPGSDALWLALGQAQEDAGERDAARRSYEQALALRPRWPFAQACLVALLRGDAPEALLADTATLADNADIDDGDRALLGYALGKARDALGEHDAAMSAWHEANAARRRVAGDPDPAALHRRVDDIIAAFPRELFDERAASASDDERPVFIVGMPRSGTTLAEQILASHPRIHGCGELPDVAMIARRLGTDFPAALRWPASRALLARGVLDEAISRFMAAATRHAPPDALRLVDKEPLDFFNLGLVALMFPHARVIWCRRDPRDIAVSIYGENFALDEALATDLGAIGHYINAQVRLMQHWRSVRPLPMLEFHYEALVADAEPNARRLVEFVGMPWDPACLDFHRTARAVQSPSRWQVRQPLHSRSAGRWRNYEAALGPLLDVLEPGSIATSPQASTPSR